MNRGLRRIRAALAGAGLLLAAVEGHGESSAAKTYPDVIRQQDAMVAARDGAMLATDVYRPGIGNAPATERLPALLHRTPY